MALYPVDGVESLAHGLVDRRMSVDGMNHRVDGCLGFHRRDSLPDQFESLRPDDVNAQDFAEFRVRDDLDEAVMHAEDTGLRVGSEREFANFDVIALRLGLRLGQSH